MGGLQFPVSDADPARLQNLRVAPDEDDAGFPQCLGFEAIIALGKQEVAHPMLLGGVLAWACQRGRVDAGYLLSSPYLIGGSEQRLRRYAGPECALSSYTISLDQSHPHTSNAEPARTGLAGNAGTNDNGIKSITSIDSLAHGFDLCSSSFTICCAIVSLPGR